MKISSEPEKALTCDITKELDVNTVLSEELTIYLAEKLLAKKQI